MTKSQISRYRALQAQAIDMPCWEYGALLDEIERLQTALAGAIADKQRLADEIYRLTDLIAKAKDAHNDDLDSDERTANRMLDVLEGKP